MITPAFAQGLGGGGTNDILMSLVPFVLIFIIMWFLIIRPQQQKMKAHRAMVDAVKKGDEVVTGGGLVGKVTKVSDNEVEIELAPNVKVRALKGTLSGVTPRGAPAAANDAKG